MFRFLKVNVYTATVKYWNIQVCSSIYEHVFVCLILFNVGLKVEVDKEKEIEFDGRKDYLSTPDTFMLVCSPSVFVWSDDTK